MIPATLVDADAVIALWTACGLIRPWNDAQGDFARAVGGAASDVLVEWIGRTAAASVMVGDDGHRGWVYYVSVDPARRGQGLGRGAMAAAESWLRARGVAKLQLMVRDDNIDALAFYRAIGVEPQAVVTLGKFLR